MKYWTALTACALIVGCSESAPPQHADTPAEPKEAMMEEKSVVPPPVPPSESEQLAGILAAQPAEVQARYQFRNPQQTLDFFGIEPGMTVVEALPGGGWYSKLLLPYLGQQGRLIGADYAVEMWQLFGFFDQETIDGKKTWTTDWTAEAEAWVEDGAPISAFVFGSMPDTMIGQADAVLFVRALHNLARFEGQGGFLTAAMDDAFQSLKPGGVVGIVQHHAAAEMPDEWANGSNGYLKQEFLVERMQQAGFEFVGSSDINVNPKDQPTAEDMVWRLPPNLLTSREDAELRAQMEAIGESNRMTLKFRKPG